ncbi:ABC transporter permease [Stomatohabitans albus]|uniref:ABC transporter permease n=1 Tax=Stomatohabitans albus TaxID=3110766 RepID=UPI00300CCDFB
MVDQILYAMFPTVVSLIGVGALTTGLAWWLGLEQPWIQPWAILRATVQLALLSVVLSGVLTHVPLTLAFLGVMVGVASLTIRQRLQLSFQSLPVIAGVVIIAVAVPMLLVFGTHALPLEGRYLLSIGGILIGHSMIASTLMGREVSQALTQHVQDVEGWLALGAPMRLATRSVMRRAGSTAVIAGTDQTRNIGVVTLPGAFVGAVFGGASVLEAGRFQLLVSSSILLVGVLVVAMWTYILGNPKTIHR